MSVCVYWIEVWLWRLWDGSKGKFLSDHIHSKIYNNLKVNGFTVYLIILCNMARFELYPDGFMAVCGVFCTKKFKRAAIYPGK